MERAVTDFQRMAELIASGVPGATTTYSLPAALGRGSVTLVAAEPGLLIALRHLWFHREQVLRRGAAPGSTTCSGSCRSGRLRRAIPCARSR